MAEARERQKFAGDRIDGQGLARTADRTACQIPGNAFRRPEKPSAWLLCGLPRAKRPWADGLKPLKNLALVMKIRTRDPNLGKGCEVPLTYTQTGRGRPACRA